MPTLTISAPRIGQVRLNDAPFFLLRSPRTAQQPRTETVRPADRPFAFDKRTQDQQAIPAGQRLEQRLSLVRVFLDLLYFHIFAYATV